MSWHYGTNEGETIYGSSLADRIQALLGNDIVVGGEGNDVIYADGSINFNIPPTTGGNDTVFGGKGRDTVFGGLGDDVIDGQEGDDVLWGDTNLGRNRLNGGNDLILGGSGNDNLIGMAGNDDLRGGPDNDRLDGGPDDDVLDGGEGRDALFGRDGNDTLRGGAGNDVLEAGFGSTYTWHDPNRLERYDTDYLYGEDGNDILIGNNDRSILVGGDGDDNLNDLNSVYIGDSFTTFIGGDGDDTIRSYRGDDEIAPGRGANQILIRHDLVPGAVTITLDADSDSNQIEYRSFDTELDIIQGFIQGRDSFVLSRGYSLAVSDLPDGTQLASAVTGDQSFDFAVLA